MVLLESKMIPLGTEAPEFELQGIDEHIYTLEDFEEKDILVVIFMCNHCPYVQAIWQRLGELEQSYDDDDSVQFVGINSNDAVNYPEDSFEKMKEYAEKYSMVFPYLYDETQQTAIDYSAVCTPDFFVFDKERKLVYRGRFDDAGANPEAGDSQDLKDAIESLLKMEEVQSTQYPSMGCSIKWKE